MATNETKQEDKAPADSQANTAADDPKTKGADGKRTFMYPGIGDEPTLAVRAATQKEADKLYDEKYKAHQEEKYKAANKETK